MIFDQQLTTNHTTAENGHQRFANQLLHILGWFTVSAQDLSPAQRGLVRTLFFIYAIPAFLFLGQSALPLLLIYQFSFNLLLLLRLRHRPAPRARFA